MKVRLDERKASLALALLIRGLFRTVRLELDDPDGFTRCAPRRPVLITFWHNRILGILQTFHRHYDFSRPGVCVFTSASRDGRLLGEVAGRFRMRAVYGSSNKRPIAATLECASVLAEGWDLAITPDGPRGPCYRLSPGVIFLAQRTGSAILPVHASFTRSFRLKTWDQFRIPAPFSKVRVRIDPQEFVPADSDDLEMHRVRIENILRHGDD